MDRENPDFPLFGFDGTTKKRAVKTRMAKKWTQRGLYIAFAPRKAQFMVESLNFLALALTSVSSYCCGWRYSGLLLHDTFVRALRQNTLMLFFNLLKEFYRSIFLSGVQNCTMWNLLTLSAKHSIRFCKQLI